MKTAQLLAATAGLTLALAGTAAADSLVYIKDGNVWVAEPDGTAAREITTKGGYDLPTQADDGTIMAKGDGFERFDRAGKKLKAPSSMALPPGIALVGQYITDLDLSPDGTKVLYGWAGLCYTCSYAGGRTGVHVSHADRYTDAIDLSYQRSPDGGVWLGNSKALMFPYLKVIDVPGPELSYGPAYLDAWVPGGRARGRRHTRGRQARGQPRRPAPRARHQRPLARARATTLRDHRTGRRVPRPHVLTGRIGARLGGGRRDPRHGGAEPRRLRGAGTEARDPGRQ